LPFLLFSREVPSIQVEDGAEGQARHRSAVLNRDHESSAFMLPSEHSFGEHLAGRLIGIRALPPGF
jgi:hypothetical protein